jgi:hypothetical protein
MGAEWFVTASTDLKAGKTVSLAPSGFGTGYTISRRRRSRYDQRAKLELEAKFGVTPLYITTFDHD